MVGRRADDLERGFTRASGGVNILTRSVSGLGGVLGALGIAAVTQQLGRLSVESIRAAGSLQQLEHATTQVLGSAAEAEKLPPREFIRSEGERALLIARVN